MFKKENRTTLIFVSIMVFFMAVIFVGAVSSNPAKPLEQNLQPQQANQQPGAVFIDTSSDPIKGSTSAPVSIVEFADFKCKWCKEWESTIFKQLQTDFIDSGKAKLYFKNLPIVSQDSVTAAIAGEAIYEQNKEKFWEYYDLMYQNQQAEDQAWADHDGIMKLVKENIQGINYEKLSSDITKEVQMTKVNQDRQAAVQVLQKFSTPTIFINGKKVEDTFNYELIKSMIESELNIQNGKK